MRRVAGLVLAAGASTRMGAGRNKLLEEVEGAPLIHGPVDALLSAEVDEVLVVLGHDEEGVRACLRSRPVRLVRHARWAEGMAGSIACGIRAIERRTSGIEGVLVTLGDLPGLRARHVRPLLEAFDSAPPGAIFRPSHGGRPGHPVLFDRRYWRELAGLRGDEGARDLLARHAESVHEVEVASPAIFEDVDTVASLESARTRLRVED